MKNVFKYITAIVVAGFAMTACSPEEFSEADGNIPQASEFADNFKITVDPATNYANFEFVSAPGVSPVWILDGATYSSSYSFSKYYRKKGSYTVQCKVKNANGISDGSIVKTFEVEKTKMTGFGGFVYDSEFNMWPKATVAAPTFWYAPGWGQIADPVYKLAVDGSYSVSLPAATTDTWQAQMILGTNIATQASKHYDFSVILTATKNHPHVMVKLTDSADDNTFYFAQTIALTANEPLCFWKSDLEGLDIATLKLVLDFGGNAENTDMTIENVVLKDHANDDGTEVPAQLAIPFDYNSSGNIWKAVDETAAFTEESWFGDAGWGTIDVTPVTSHQGSSHIITIPADTPAEEWHAQWKLHSQLNAETNSTVDFSLKVSATLNGAAVKLPGMTVKLTDSADDGNFFFAKREAIPAGGFVFRVEDAKLSKAADAAKLSVVFDFGGAPKDAVITISEIVLIKK